MAFNNYNHARKNELAVNKLELEISNATKTEKLMM